MTKTEVTLGIDIGGTNTAYGYVDRIGNCVFESSILTNGHESADHLFSRLKIAIDESYAKLSDRYKLIGIGIGAPNANYYKGTVELPPNLNWGYVNVIEIMKKYYDLPSVITNDANAAAIGEMKFGAAKGMRNFIMITLGTGVGSGIVANGNLIYGADGFAGEIGHTIFDPDGRQCGCGRKGCLETYASAGGIKRTVFELLALYNDDSELRELSFNDMTSKIISEAARKGDRIALKAFDETGRILGIKLADAIAHTSPEAIILFGGLASSGELIFKPTRKYLEQYTLNIFKNKVKLIPSALTGGNAAILGASALIWNELDGVQSVYK